MKYFLNEIYYLINPINIIQCSLNIFKFNYYVNNLSFHINHIPLNKKTLFFFIEEIVKIDDIFIRNVLYNTNINFFVINRNFYPKKKFFNTVFFIVNNVLESYLNIVLFYKKKFKTNLILVNNNQDTIVNKILFSILNSYNFIVYISFDKNNLLLNLLISLFNLNNLYDFVLLDTYFTSVYNINSSIFNIISKYNILNIGIFNNNDNILDYKNKNKIINLFSKFDYLIISKDNKSLYKFITTNINFKNNNILHYSIYNKCDLFISSIIEFNNYYILILKDKGKKNTLLIKKKNYNNIESVLSSFLILKILKFNIHVILYHLSKINFINRSNLCIMQGNSKCTLLIDKCNNNIFSLKENLFFLYQKKYNKKITLILLDSFNIYNYLERKYYHYIFNLIKYLKFFRVIIIGNNTFLKRISNNAYTYFHNLSFFKKKIKNTFFNNEVILFKSTYLLKKFNILIKSFIKNTNHSIYKISLQKLINNFNYFKSKLYINTKIMIMLKANAYGHGVFCIANILEKYNADYIGVATINEGIELRKINIKIPILVTNPNPKFFHVMYKYKLEPEVMSFDILNIFINFIKKIKISSSCFPIHIKLDSGMNRSGFLKNEIGLLGFILNKNNIFVKSIFSHLSSSDTINEKIFTLKQIYLFDNLYNILISYLNNKPIKHILNSSGVIFYSHAQYDMVRIGIGIYGLNSNIFIQNNLLLIGSLQSKIYQIKFISLGDYVGYNKGFINNKKNFFKIATVPIGYADGLKRSISKNNKYYVLVNGFKAYILGYICMDIIMIDINNINCKIGDKVIIFNNSTMLNSISNICETNNYEILSSISKRINRIYYL